MQSFSWAPKSSASPRRAFWVIPQCPIKQCSLQMKGVKETHHSLAVRWPPKNQSFFLNRWLLTKMRVSIPWRLFPKMRPPMETDSMDTDQGLGQTISKHFPMWYSCRTLGPQLRNLGLYKSSGACLNQELDLWLVWTIGWNHWLYLNIKLFLSAVSKNRGNPFQWPPPDAL